MYLKFCKYICCHQDINISHPAIEILLAFVVKVTESENEMESAKNQLSIMAYKKVEWTEHFVDAFKQFNNWPGKLEFERERGLEIQPEARIKCRLDYVNVCRGTLEDKLVLLCIWYLVLLSGT